MYNLYVLNYNINIKTNNLYNINFKFKKKITKVIKLRINYTSRYGDIFGTPVYHVRDIGNFNTNHKKIVCAKRMTLITFSTYFHFSISYWLITRTVSNISSIVFYNYHL